MCRMMTYDNNADVINVSHFVTVLSQKQTNGKLTTYNVLQLRCIKVLLQFTPASELRIAGRMRIVSDKLNSSS